jgi:hypothetical protein
MDMTVVSAEMQAPRARWSELLLFFFCALLALLVFAQYDLLHAPLLHDMSLQMYSAQLIARGLPPYVTVGLVKTPLTGIAGALMIFLGNLFGVWDVLAVRFGFWLLMGLGAGGMYLWTRTLFASRAAGVIAALTLLSFPLIGYNTVLGPQPKTLVMVAAIYAFYFLARAQWFWAGIAASLAFLAWQPAALLDGIVLWMPLLDADGKRLPAFARALAGAALPVLSIVAYLVVKGALSAALQDTFAANLTYLHNSNAQLSLPARVLENAARLGRRLNPPGCFEDNRLAGAGLVGIALLGAMPLWSGKWRAGLSRRMLPVFLYALLFAGFALVDFQVCNDLMPFAPILALGVGMLAALAQRWLIPRLSAHRALHVSAVGLGVGLYFAATSGPVWLAPPEQNMRLDEQVARVNEIGEMLKPDDQVQQVGDALVLVVLKKQNPTKLIFFGPKTGTAILEQIPGGIVTVIRQLENAPPRLITLSHIQESDWSDDFIAWVEKHYTRLRDYDLFPGENASVRVYLRKE